MSQDRIFTSRDERHISYKLLISPEPGKSPLLLFIHFWGGSASTWSALMARLSPAHHMLAMSLRGWGNSSGPSDAGAYSISGYADDIVDLLQDERILRDISPALANGIVLIGHSMGGKIAQYLISRLRTLDTFTGITLKVVLVAPAPSGSFALDAEMKQTQIHAYDSPQIAEHVVRNVLLARPDSVHDATVQDLVRDAVRGNEQAKAAWPEYGMAEDYEALLVDTLQALDVNAKPVFLVVTGDCDRVETTENVRKRVVTVLQGAGARVRHEELRSGHLIPVEAPNELAQLIHGFIASA